MMMSYVTTVIKTKKSSFSVIRFFKNITRGISISSTNTQKNGDYMHVFDRNTKILQRTRAALAQDVNLYDYLKDEIGYRLADRVFDIKRKFKLAADVGGYVINFCHLFMTCITGCSRGYVSKHISPDCVEELILCDTSRFNMDSFKVQEGIKVRKQILDEEEITVNTTLLETLFFCNKRPSI